MVPSRGTGRRRRRQTLEKGDRDQPISSAAACRGMAHCAPPPPAPGSSEPPCPKLLLEAEGREQTMISVLQSMLNNPILSDLCLLCKDGVKVHACRLLLMARSDVLRQMLSNGMVESGMSEISLPEISSSALLPTLEYLYTGAITHYVMDLGTAFLVFHAASFFNLPTLEARLKPLLLTLVGSLSEYPAILAEQLSTLEAYGIIYLLDDVVSVILGALRRHCCTASPSLFLRHLSFEALPSLLECLVTKNMHSTVFSFMEYVCARSLLIWGATLISAEAEEFFERALPNEDSLALHFAALKSSGKPFLEVGFNQEKMKVDGLLTANEVKFVEDLQEVLINAPWKLEDIKLARIHPVLLVSVLKPLNVLDITSLRLEKALQYQALHTGEMNLMKWCLREQGAIHNYEVQENGAVLLAKTNGHDEKTPWTNLAAWTNISFSKPSGVHEISFSVEEPAQVMRIIVRCAPAYSKRTSGNFKARGRFTCDGAAVRLSAIDNEGLTGKVTLLKLVNAPTRLKSGDRVDVVVDMSKKQCVFQFKGYELVLGNLLDEVFLTVYLMPCGKVRATLVSDNTFL